MAMTITIDPRTTVLGNLLLVTGTFQDDGTRNGALSLDSHFQKIIWCSAVGLNDLTSVAKTATNDRTIGISCAAGNISGTWVALGIRG